MCGRYASFLPAEAVAKIFGTKPSAEPRADLEYGTHDGRADCPAAPKNRRTPARRPEVGVGPYFTKDLKKARKPINARSESIGKQDVPERLARRRCLVPAPAYYEWRDDPDGKTPFTVARVDGDPVAFGGVWETWKSPDGELLQTFATITTDANRQLNGIQDRMPVIIERGDWPLWLGEVDGDPASLLRPAPEGILRTWQVGKAVGNVKNNGAELIEPCAPAAPTLL